MVNGISYLAGQKSGECPPLTQDEVMAIRGQPVAKVLIEQGANPSVALKEEWVYLTDSGVKEYFLFYKGCLAGWTNKENL